MEVTDLVQQLLLHANHGSCFQCRQHGRSCNLQRAKRFWTSRAKVPSWQLTSTSSFRRSFSGAAKGRFYDDECSERFHALLVVAA